MVWAGQFLVTGHDAVAIKHLSCCNAHSDLLSLQSPLSNDAGSRNRALDPRDGTHTIGQSPPFFSKKHGSATPTFPPPDDQMPSFLRFFRRSSSD